MWKNDIRNIAERFLFNEPASAKEIEEIKSRFNIQDMDELRSFLEETDGVNDEMNCHFVWPASRIIEENSEQRSNEICKEIYMPFDSLLFVADAGNGDLFGYSIINGSIQKDDIYTWSHEDDSRTWVAPSLLKFIEWWNDGTITL
ncbi:SMI1/KNR4 family protein [Paenibacillus sp. sgz500958]|uniref:SMI1/KNR4 family protein n=1 Tax=Paenibacillus sp. sgz500958 TaxID=3242475 RepID=UPI0036D2CEAB